LELEIYNCVYTNNIVLSRSHFGAASSDNTIVIIRLFYKALNSESIIIFDFNFSLSDIVS